MWLHFRRARGGVCVSTAVCQIQASEHYIESLSLVLKDASFKVFCGCLQNFSQQNMGALHLLAAPVSNLQKFSLRNFFFIKIFSCNKFPAIQYFLITSNIDHRWCTVAVYIMALCFFLLQIEPFFLTLALYDAQKGVKISENFHVDLNSPALRQMVPPSLGTTEKGPHLLSDKATRATTVSS